MEYEELKSQMMLQLLQGLTRLVSKSNQQTKFTVEPSPKTNELRHIWGAMKLEVLKSS